MVYVLLADGFEEVEALTPVDLLRRAGADVKTVGITGKTVTSSHNVPIIADILPEDVCFEEAEMVVLPGGMPGAINLNESEFVHKLVRYCADNDRYIGAICAAPSVILGSMDLLKHKKAICYPGMEDGMTLATVVHQNCCVDGKIITGRALGGAMDFALALCTAIMGDAAAKQVADAICYVPAE